MAPLLRQSLNLPRLQLSVSALWGSVWCGVRSKDLWIVGVSPMIQGNTRVPKKHNKRIAQRLILSVILVFTVKKE